MGQTNYKGVSGANWGADGSQKKDSIGTLWANPGTNGSADGLNNGDGLMWRTDYLRPMQDADVRDGLSNTFLLGEDLPEKNLWCSWPYANNAYGTCAIPPNYTYRDPNWWPNTHSFRSAHPTGLNFALADGSVRFFSQYIALATYRAGHLRGRGDRVRLLSSALARLRRNSVPDETCALSLILPAYNEAARLPPFLATVHAYLDGLGQTYELIVVDDGSRDTLADELERQALAWPQLRVLRHPQNQGKGAAVRTGVLASRGELLLFADADGATPIEEHARLAAAIGAGADVAIGSRRLPGPGVRRERRLFRGLAGALFAVIARLVLGLPVSDTQCGFKMFCGEAGRRLFSITRENRFLFDLELLAAARRLGYRTVEVPINWREIPFGQLHPLRELPRIVSGLWRLRSQRRKAGFR